MFYDCVVIIRHRCDMAERLRSLEIAKANYSRERQLLSAQLLIAVQSQEVITDVPTSLQLSVGGGGITLEQQQQFFQQQLVQQQQQQHTPQEDHRNHHMVMAPQQQQVLPPQHVQQVVQQQQPIQQHVMQPQMMPQPLQAPQSYIGADGRAYHLQVAADGSPVFVPIATIGSTTAVVNTTSTVVAAPHHQVLAQKQPQ